MLEAFDLPFDLWRDISTIFPIVVTIETGRYIAAAGLVSLIVGTFWRAYFRARKIQQRSADAADIRREIAASLRTAFLFSIVGYSMHLANKAEWMTIYEDFSVRGPAYFFAALAAMIVAHDAYFYWTHRAMHHPLLFRMFHWTHHKSKSPTPWAAYSFDLPEAILTVAFVPLWAALLPMHDLGLFAFTTWQIVRNVMGHAGVELSPVSGRPSRLFGWLNTTTHHDLHHQDARTNFGLYFTWWDRLMGTEHPEYQQRVAAIANGAETDRAPSGAQGDGAQQNAGLKARAPGVLLAALVCFGALTENAQAQSQDIAGRWATRGFGSIVEFHPCAEAADTMCGRIVWLWVPNDSAERPRADARNPDRSLRTRPLIGVEIVRGLRETAPGVWSEGSLYNPDDGRTYTGAIRLRNGALELRGCALNVFCQTQIWRRPDDVLAAVREL